jgi:hypothetical protein
VRHPFTLSPLGHVEEQVAEVFVRLNMQRRRERFGNQKVILNTLTCDACGKPFMSGHLQVERRFAVEAMCNAFYRRQSRSFRSLIEDMFDPSYRRRTTPAGGK